MGFLAQRTQLLNSVRGLLHQARINAGEHAINALGMQLESSVREWKKSSGAPEPKQNADGKTEVCSGEEQSTLYLVFLTILEEIMCDHSRNPQTEGGPVGVLLDLSMWAAERDYLEGAAPMSLLESAFEYETIDGCKHIFHFLQSRVNSLATGLLWESKKSRLAFLRIANGLLRRLSKINDATICGEILMLIAYVFPLDDPSGQNKTGKTNTANITLFEIVDGVKDKTADLTKVTKEEGKTAEPEEKKTTEITEVDMKPVTDGAPPAQSKVDMTFYSTFWGLQQFFVEPALLKPQFASLKTGVETVLDAFEKHPLTSLDAMSAQSKDYFPKYLTSSKLMELQLRDPAFRRHILLQCLVLLQSLASPAYCQKIGVVLSMKQAEVVEALKSRVTAVLEKTPEDADAKSFARQVREVIFENEKMWAKWKDEEKCPKMQLQPVDISKKVVVAKTEAKELTKKDTDKKEGAPDALLEVVPGLEETYTIAKTKSGKLVMGNPELGRLWALQPNMDVCGDEGRDFAPKFNEFLNQMLSEETAPDDNFGEETRLKNDPVYVWRCLRLMQGEDFGLFLKASGGIKAFCEHMVEELKGNSSSAQAPDDEKGQDGDPDASANAEDSAPREKETEKEPEAEKEADAEDGINAQAAAEESEGEQVKKKRKRDDDATEESPKKEQAS